MSRKNKKDRKPFRETGFGKFLNKGWVQGAIQGTVGEIPLLGNAISGILKPRPDGKFNWQPNWKRAAITGGLAVLIGVAVSQGWIKPEHVDIVKDAIESFQQSG